MRGDPKLDLLRRVPLFSTLNGRELARLAKLMDEVDVRPGRYLIREGRRGNEFFVLVNGRVRIEQNDQPIRELGPGDFFGEIALVDGGPRTASAVAVEDSRVLVLTAQNFRSMLDSTPQVESKVLRALAQRLRRLDPTAH
jgi:CRP/FNR family transcriptional regulator, cyclic AMP receptor protein